MNYLAHLFLARNHPELVPGSLAADFLKGERLRDYSPALCAGVRFHHAVDRFTDDHPVFRESRGRFRAPFRRYAGILVDVFYDHFLADDWSTYSPDVSLQQFTKRTYARLVAVRGGLPPRLQRVLPSLVEHDWLSSYQHRPGIARTLNGLSQRINRENPLGEAIGQLDIHRDALKADFRLFFPELLEKSAEFARHSLAGEQSSASVPSSLSLRDNPLGS